MDTMTSITPEERARRLKAVNYARASIGLEGFKLSEADEEHARQFVAGEIDLAEYVTPRPDLATSAPEELPGYTLDRVRAALAGEFNADQLSPDEELLFADLFTDYLMQPNTENQALATMMLAKGGYVGEDEHGNLVRTVLGGGTVPLVDK